MVLCGVFLFSTHSRHQSLDLQLECHNVLFLKDVTMLNNLLRTKRLGFAFYMMQQQCAIYIYVYVHIYVYIYPYIYMDVRMKQNKEKTEIKSEITTKLISDIRSVFIYIVHLKSEKS